MNILLTNDDGIHSEGLRIILEYLKKIKEINVFVIAPDTQRSAVGVSLSLHRPLRLIKLEKNIFISDGTPADCVNLALFSGHPDLPKKIDLVISGINSGPNLGQDVFYSGTVGAALEAQMHSISAIAVSCCAFNDKTYNYHIPAFYTAQLLKNVLLKKKILTKKILTLNLNAPAVKNRKEIKGVKFTRIG